MDSVRPGRDLHVPMFSPLGPRVQPTSPQETDLDLLVLPDDAWGSVLLRARNVCCCAVMLKQTRGRATCRIWLNWRRLPLSPPRGEAVALLPCLCSDSLIQHSLVSHLKRKHSPAASTQLHRTLAQAEQPRASSPFAVAPLMHTRTDNTIAHYAIHSRSKPGPRCCRCCLPARFRVPWRTRDCQGEEGHS